MNGKTLTGAICAAALLACQPVAVGYPIDDYERTGIHRLEFYRLAQEGEISGRKLPAGSRWSASDITLAHPTLPVNSDGYVELPFADTALSGQIVELLASEDQPRYGIAVLDYTDALNPLYAEHNGQYLSNVGSVGKLLVGISILQQLADLYPDSIDARERLLRTTQVTADEYAVYDHHKVPIFNVAARDLDYRALKTGDSGSLWEYLDWMFSASSNAAASMVVQQSTLFKHFAGRYPLPASAHAAWLKKTPWDEEGEVTVSALTDALEANGLDTAEIRQGSYFTRNGKRAAAGVTSYATPRSLVRLLGMLESGTLIDDWSSLELKRLLYMTQKRIRYASHPALHDSAVYFKSGSLYSCKEEPGYTCGKYKGNRKNILASIAIVESPADPAAGLPALRYAVAVVSNVLYKNSAVAHQTLAMRIHRLLEKHHKDSARVAENH